MNAKQSRMGNGKVVDGLGGGPSLNPGHESPESSAKIPTSQEGGRNGRSRAKDAKRI